MKMHPEHYEALKGAMVAVMTAKPEARAGYAAAGLTEKRYAWDVLWATKVRIGTSRNADDLPLYDYLNDDHINTAVLRITREHYSGAPYAAKAGA